MHTIPLPIINLAFCTGCRLCIEHCPTQALDQTAGKAYLRDPQRCNYCAVCEDICPENAISLPFMIVLARRDGPQE